MDRVVATSSVSPVSTGQLFPSLVACLELPISAIAHQTPMQGPPKHTSDMLKLERWLQTVQKILIRVFLPTTFRSSKQTISLASLICKGHDLRDKRTIRKPKPVLYDTMGRNGRYSYRSTVLTQKWSQKQSHIQKLLG